ERTGALSTSPTVSGDTENPNRADTLSASAPRVVCLRLSSSTAATPALTTRWRSSTATMKRSSPSYSPNGFSSTSGRRRGVMVLFIGVWRRARLRRARASPIGLARSELERAAARPFRADCVQPDRYGLHLEAGFELGDGEGFVFVEGIVRRIHRSSFLESVWD